MKQPNSFKVNRNPVVDGFCFVANQRSRLFRERNRIRRESKDDPSFANMGSHIEQLERILQELEGTYNTKSKNNEKGKKMRRSETEIREEARGSVKGTRGSKETYGNKNNKCTKM